MRGLVLDLDWTGWAQIHGRDNLSWKEKIEYDIEFVRCSKMKKVYLCVFIILFTPFYLLNFSATYEKRNNFFEEILKSENALCFR